MGFLLGGSAGKAQAAQPVAAQGLRIQTSVLGKSLAILWGTNRVPGNLIWSGAFTAIAQQAPSGGGGGKGAVGGGSSKGGGGGTTSYTYTTSVAIGLLEGSISSVGRVWANQSVFADPGSAGFSVFAGGYSQSAWSYLSSNFPGQDLNYRGIAYVAAANLDLGSNPQIAQYSWEVFGQLQYGGGIVDSNPRDVISDALTSTSYGMAGIVPLATTTQYSNYCVASGIFLSPMCDSSETLASFLTRMLTITNSTCVWAAPGQLKLLPYGDKTVSGNGVTFTPDLTPQYDLDDDAFLPQRKTPPLVGKRSNPADAYNQLTVEGVDRSDNYNVAPAEWKDQGSIDLYGLLPAQSVISEHGITNPSVASVCAQLIGRRQLYVRNTYQFSLGLEYSRLEAGDLVTVTDNTTGGLGIYRQLVRLTKVDYGDAASEKIDCEAEDVLVGTAAPAAYGATGSTGYSANYNVAPPSTNLPIIFAPPLQIASSTPELWMAASGPDGWGGCEVWVSTNDATYAKVGIVHGSARMGTLRTPFPVGPDPDTTDTLSVDLTESRGELLSGTASDADLDHTLCYVDGELVAYETATLVSQYKYDLGTYIRRGQYGTPIGAHLNGSAFARLDDSIFGIPYTAEQIGSTIYVKLPAFNVFGGALQSLADVTATSIVVPNPPIPPDVTGFAADQNGGSVAFTWTPIRDYALKGYDILYAPQGTTDITLFLPLTEATRGSEMTNASVPPGSWTFAIRARDVLDQLSADVTTFDLVVVNASTTISAVEQEKDWLGAAVNFFRHVTGVLVPLGTKNVSDYTQVSAPSAPSLTDTAGGALAGVTYYVKVTYTTPTGGETTPSAESNRAVAVNRLLKVTSPGASSPATGYNVYVSTSTGTETKQNATPIALGTDWTEPTSGLISGAALPTTNSTGWEPFDVFVPDPVASASYTSVEVDTGYDASLRVFATSAATPGPGQTGVPTLPLSIDTWLTGQVDPGVYTPWTVGTLTLRYLKAKIDLTVTAGQVPYVSDFTPTIDESALITQQAASVAVSPGGTTLTFPNPFHDTPFVQVTAISGTARYGTANNITKTTFDAHVFNSAGTDVGGTINWTAEGD